MDKLWHIPPKLVESAPKFALRKLKEKYPPGEKRDPATFWSSDVAYLLGMSQSMASKLIPKTGVQPIIGSDRPLYSPESIADIRAYLYERAGNNEYKRSLAAPRAPSDKPPYVVSVSNLKGGSGKSTLAIHAAIWFALRGWRTLIIDADPQGSATTSMGLLPVLDLEKEGHPLMIHEDESILSVFENKSIHKVRKTSWSTDNEFCKLDIIPAIIDDYYSEMILASYAAHEGLPYHLVLRQAINDYCTGRYDVVIIDTPPSFSLTTTNATFASNALMIPVPPLSLDLQATMSYFDKLDEIFTELEEFFGKDASHMLRFVKTVPMRVDVQQESIDNIATMKELFGEMMARDMVPVSKAFRASSQHNLSIFEGFSQGLFSRRLYRDVFNSLSNIFEEFEGDAREFFGLPKAEGTEFENIELAMETEQ